MRSSFGGGNTEHEKSVNQKDDSLSNGPSDLNKKLKVLNKQRGSTDRLSNSVISKKEMMKLKKE